MWYYCNECWKEKSRYCSWCVCWRHNSIVWSCLCTSRDRQRKALEQVEISFHEARLKNIGFSGASLEISLRMYNPNDTTTATLDRADYDLWFNDNYLGSGQMHQRLDIPPKTSHIANTDFDMDFEGAGQSILSAITTGKS